MKAFLGLMVLVVAVAVISIYGCGPRGDVAMNSVFEKIDKFLGEIKVQRQTIENQKEKIEKDLATIRDKRIETQSRMKLLAQKEEVAKKRVAEIVDKTKRLRALIEDVKKTGEFKTRDGKPMTAEELKAAGDELAEDYQLAKTDLEDNLQASISAMQQALDYLQKQETAGNKKIAEIRQKLTLIDSKRESAEAVRSAQGLAGGATSITEKFEALDKNLDDLTVSVDTLLAKDSEDLQRLDSATSKADELLAEPADLNSTADKLDAILGNLPDVGTGDASDDKSGDGGNRP